MVNQTIVGSGRLPLNELTPHPRNPRKGDIEGIRASLRRFGQVRPLVVLDDQANTIVAGNHTYYSMQDEQFVDAAFVRVSLSPDEALAYAIADNRLSDRAGYDDESLISILNELSGAGGLEGTGFDQDDLEDLVAAIENVPETTQQQFGGDYAEPPEDTAARWEGRNEGARREVVFLLLEEDFQKFNELITVLQSAWNMSSKAQTIYQAVLFAYERAEQFGVKPAESYAEQHKFSTSSSGEQEQRVSITPITESNSPQ